MAMLEVAPSRRKKPGSCSEVASSRRSSESASSGHGRCRRRNRRDKREDEGAP